ncbi:MAG: hypothetical protein R3C02_04765 [Planctomycetaceae bacterium]
MASEAIILGYADPVVDEAVREQIGKGTIYSINHELEVELAEELVNSFPVPRWCGMLKEAGMPVPWRSASPGERLAATKILFSGYHGWHDWYLCQPNLQADKSLDSHLFPGIDPTGVPVSGGHSDPVPLRRCSRAGEPAESTQGSGRSHHHGAAAVQRWPPEGIWRRPASWRATQESC